MGSPIAGLQDAIPAIAALGTAAYGLVDGSKALRGGVSNHGFGYIEQAMRPFQTALDQIGQGAAWSMLKANWLNGVAKSDQKAAAKGLLRLGLTEATAPEIARLTNVDPDALAAAAQKCASGTELVQADLNVLGRLDAEFSVILDAAYERADQQYRNAARAWASVAAVVLAILAVWNLGEGNFTLRDFVMAVAIGLVATPLAPVAKDLASSLQAAVTAMTAARK